MIKTRQFKPVNISTADWEEYNATAMQLSVERGKRVSVPALLREAYKHYLEVI